MSNTLKTETEDLVNREAFEEIDIEKDGKSSSESISGVESQKENAAATTNQDIEANKNVKTLCRATAWVYEAVAKAPSLFKKKDERVVAKSIVRDVNEIGKGYPFLAAFQSGSEESMIFRKFGFLHTRLILQKQSELQDLERLLDTVDITCVEENDPLSMLEEERSDTTGQTPFTSSRKDLFDRIEESLTKYDQLLINTHTVMGFHRPAEREYKSLGRFMKGNRKNLLIKREADFWRHRQDVVTLRPGREHAWIDYAIRPLLRILPRKLIQWLLYCEDSYLQTKDKDHFNPSERKVTQLVKTIIMGWIVSLIGVPIYLLYYVGSKSTCANRDRTNIISMVILLISTTLFAGGMAILTKAKRHEMLAAAAAYCALLVVFIANLGAEETKKSCADEKDKAEKALKLAGRLLGSSI